MSEKIDLGKNPFGSLADEDDRPLDEVAPDVLSDLMQVPGSAPVPAAKPEKSVLVDGVRPAAIDATEAAALSFDPVLEREPIAPSPAPEAKFDSLPELDFAPKVAPKATPKVESPWPDLGVADPFSSSSQGAIFGGESKGFTDVEPEVEPQPAPASEPAGSAAAPIPATPAVEPVPPPRAAQPTPTPTVAPTTEPTPAVTASTSAPTGDLQARPPEPIDQRKLWLLRILLVSNLAMMLVMLLMPHPMETRTEYVKDSDRQAGPPPDGRSLPQGQPLPSGNASRARPEAFVQPPRELSLGLPNDPLYEKALVQALDGDFVAASATLREFLDAHPGLDPALQRLVHAHLAYYLRKAGAIPESIEHETKSRELAGRSFLPEELLRKAREAELRGDGDGMRRAYAQFLLQEEQLPPALRALVQEAYLKLGDAYRIEAENGESAQRSARQLEGAGK